MKSLNEMYSKRVNSLVLVYPGGLYYDKAITKFYDDFIEKYLLYHLPEVKIILITKNDTVTNLLQKKFISSNITIKSFSELGGIWVRDWGPFQVTQKDLSIIYYKAKYCYEYYPENEKIYGEKDNNAGYELCDLLSSLNPNTLIEDLDLYLDGGNLTHNEDGTAIITEKLLIDNSSKHSPNQIENVLKSKFGFNKIIFIPVEPCDVLGHTDGIVRFISKDKLLLAQYPEQYIIGNEYLNQVKDILKRELPSKIQIIRLQIEQPKDHSSSGVYSAWGNYINFLQVNNKVFFPWYEANNFGEVSFKTLQTELPKCDIVKIPDVDSLSTNGGVLNCITQTYC
ncbi:MAG: agmatine deiminase family protein [Ignavibacteria bacterium]|nr:agmatine deiminase family protein [Ignavibacteria bacterium]